MYLQRIKEVKGYFNTNDTDLGFRRLIDCVLDTQDMALYKEAINLTQWKYSQDFSQKALKEKSIALLDKLESINITPTERICILKAQHISKTYQRQNFTLDNVSVEINKGQIYGLVGENGNGKTTLLRILAKELAYDKGNISYNFSENLQTDYDLRTKLVYIPQRTQKWYGSLLDNLKFVLSNYGISADEIETRVLLMVARFGLWEYKDLKWKELSSGYKMRFELVRTMLRKPEVLLLDEPLANLDVLAQQLVLEDLKSIGNSINNPIAIILSSQQLYEVEKVSDKIIFLKKGKQTAEEQEDNIKELIIEIESRNSKTELSEVFKYLTLNKLVFNGGMYVAYFSEQTTFNEVLKALGVSDVEVQYLRDISKSTRRFFV